MENNRFPSPDCIGARFQLVQDRIRAACERSGRNPEHVQLIAVSKTKPLSAVQEAWEAGARCFGENYVQELTQKQANLLQISPSQAADMEWHMIGHLQRNKVRSLIGAVAMIHSVDTVSLAAQIEKEAAKQESTMNILLEVNIAEEPSKWGFSAADVFSAAEAVSHMSHLRLRGLMTSAPLTQDPETNRPYFLRLNLLAQALFTRGLILPGENGFPVLSMGMSGDFEVAIEEGATMVRVGSSIFGERTYAPDRGHDPSV